MLAYYTLSISKETLVAGGILCAGAFIIFAGIWAKRRITETKERTAKETEELEREKILELFPKPWIIAYYSCQKSGDSNMRIMWFQRWFQKRSASMLHVSSPLPELSGEAIEQFAHMISGSGWYNGNYTKAMAKLASFLKIENIED